MADDAEQVERLAEELRMHDFDDLDAVVFDAEPVARFVLTSDWLREREARAKAEALRQWISEWPTEPGDGTFLANVARDGLARADRIEAESAALDAGRAE